MFGESVKPWYRPIMPDEAPDTRTQHEKFADMARELECDESEERFLERFRAIAPARTESKKKDWSYAS